MSTEYYTGVPFDEAKAKLLANLGERVFEERGEGKYVAACRAFTVSVPGCTLWFTCEHREHPCARVGTMGMERFGGNDVRLLMPWIVETLGVSPVSDLGIDWEETA